MTEGTRNSAWRRALELTAPIGRDPRWTLPSTIYDLTRRLGGAPAILSFGESLSYEVFGKRIDQYSRWAIAQQLTKGDVVGLLLPNSPDYIAFWLGLTRIGCIVALVNTNLRGAALAQAIALVSPRHMVVGVSLAATIAPIAGQLDPACRFWTHGGAVDGWTRIDVNDEAGDSTANNGALSQVLAARAPLIGDPALYLYTSGTTGTPKAVPISHYRLMQWSFWFAGMIDVKPEDRMYNCLPMYHSVGGIVANGAMLVSGGSIVLRERFSASRFWTDVAQSDCTLFQYIGEMCRYLVNSPTEPFQNIHRIRLACGNGLRREVWEVFQQRFGVPRILEFYAATEGNVSLYNIEGRPGSIGRIPAFLAHRSPMALVKFDFNTERPMRDSSGFCIRCEIDEPGEAIGRIPNDRTSMAGRFEGYLDPVASEAKILRDVFALGDAWYRTGDLLRRDNARFYYFVDRVGDTFRWKSENVSTEEVAGIVAACPGVTSAAVYGVAVPGHEGRAGMAAIVVHDGFDLRLLDDTLAECLPDYARPVFLRLLAKIEVTGTFKHQKQELVRDGYDVSIVADPVYMRDRRNTCFARLDAEGLAAIRRGVVAF